MRSLTRKLDPSAIHERILILRGQRVLLDSDLAELYGVPTKALNQAVRRNRDRFPKDFGFRLRSDEAMALNRSQIVTGSQRHRDPRFPPLAFTDYGAIMAATVLNCPRAVEMSVYVVRAFVKLREILTSNVDLVSKLEELEKSVAALDAKTRRQLEQVYAAIRALMARPAPKSQPIGFTADIGSDR